MEEIAETTFSVDWQAERRRFERTAELDVAVPTSYDLEAWAGQLEPLLLVPKVPHDAGTGNGPGHRSAMPDVPTNLWLGYLDDLSDDKRESG